MKNSSINHGILIGYLALISFAPTVCYAEIFKWVDANGHTHYSENKEDAGESKMIEIKVSSPPASVSSQPQKSSIEQVKELLDKLHKMQESKLSPPIFTNNIRNGTLPHEPPISRDASACNLARNVISGAVKHKNGAATDQNDRDTAQNDIRSFCH